jgi:hypothetical protein
LLLSRRARSLLLDFPTIISIRNQRPNAADAGCTLCCAGKSNGTRAIFWRTAWSFDHIRSGQIVVPTVGPKTGFGRRQFNIFRSLIVTYLTAVPCATVKGSDWRAWRRTVGESFNGRGVRNATKTCRLIICLIASSGSTRDSGPDVF